MAIITRPRFKISQDPGSNKAQGLRVGDLALRQYSDNTTQFYSLLLVDEIGGTQATGNYFVGQLIDGDEPGATGVELLDFVRVTNIIDETRMGAVYISGSGSDAPRIDALADGGKESSICWPTFAGAGGYEALNYTGTFGSGFILDEPMINSKRAFKITRNSTSAAEAWFLKSSVSLSSDTVKMTVGKQYVISYRYRANKSVSIPQTVSDSDGLNQSASWVDAATTSWQYRSIVFSCEYSTSSTQWSANLASALSSGDWIEYADFTVIPVDSMKIIRSSVKSCFGNMTGITDPVFGQLRDYGGYFQRLYATKDVNIAGTLTAGDENGFGTTFYAGKIAKNLITNSDLRPENTNNSGIARSVIQTSLPIGVVGSAVNLSTTGSEPLHSFFLGGIRQRSIVTFSVWAKSTTESSIMLFASDQGTSAGSISETHQLTNEWRRVFISFDTARLTTAGTVLFRANPSPHGVGNSIQLWGYQVEYGKTPTPYQQTDGSLSSSTDYGMWANRGGFGGTIQNPILKLQPDGTIVGGNNKLILRPDGSAEFNGTVVISGSGGQPLDVEQAINQAKGEAISTSSADATAKANQAKAAAEAAAALDAAAKAAAAKSEAISTASSDASSKAGTAKSEAINVAASDATTKANSAVTTALGNTITEIGKIAVGGRNLLRNSRQFTIGAAANGISASIVGGELKVVSTSPNGNYLNVSLGALLDSDLKNGDIITVSYWCKSPDTDKIPTLYLKSGMGYYTFQGTAESTYKQFSIVVPWQKDGAFLLHFGFSGLTGTFYFSGIKIEKGNKATDWTPAPEDVDANITSQFNASKQFATDSITDLKNNYLGDLALLDTLDGGKITNGTIAFAKLGSTIISGGYIKTELLDANAIRTNIINVNYIEGLSLNFVRGNIGGWVISSTALTSSGNKTILSADGSGQLASGAISWDTAGAVTFNTSVKSNWESYTDAAKAAANAYTDASSSATLTASQQYANSSISDLKTNYLGDLAILDTLNGGKITDSTISFAKFGSTIVSGGYIKTELLDANAIRANIINVWYIEGLSLNFTKGFIGGWTISSAALSSIGNKSVLRSDGSGQLASGNIGWDAAGNVTFGENVQLNWKSYADSAVAGVVVGGRNIIRGSKCIVNGVIANVINNGATLSVDNTTTYNGEPTMKVVGDGGFSWSNLPLLEPGVEYTISMMVKSDRARTGDLNVPVHIQIPAGSHEHEELIKADSSLTTEWKQIYLVAKNTSSDPQLLMVFLYSISDRVVNVAWVKVEKGNKPTDWTPAPEDDDYLKTNIDANGIYTGTLTTQQLNAAKATVLGNVTAGSFNLGSGKFSVASDGTLNANGVNISGTLNSAAGNIGGWAISPGVISNGKVQMNSDQQSVYVNKQGGGHVMLGQTFVGGAWTGKYGFSVVDPSHRALVRFDESINLIAGWQFDYSRIYSGTMELGSAGYIRNTADKWRLNQDGSGSFASGKFSFDAAGNAQIAGWGFDANKLYSDGNKSELRKDGSFKLASGQIVGDVAGNVTLGANVKLAWGTDPKNLLDWSGWTLGSDPVTYFNRAGDPDESKREMIIAPDGRYSIGWVCATNWEIDPEINWETQPGNADGGWGSADIQVDNKYPYRYCCWVKHEAVSGVKYHGTLSVSNLTGSDVEYLNTNPYFISHDVATIDNKDKWYLMVGYIHPAGYQGNYIGISGIYDTTGRRISTGTEYKFMNAQSSCSFRSFYYEAKAIGARMLLYAPCVHKIDGTEPSLAQIIGNRIVTTNIDSNGIYTGTLTANQIKTGDLTVGGTNVGGIGKVRVLDAENNELVKLGIDGITATKGVIGGMTIQSNKLTGGNIEITSGAIIGGFTVAKDGLSYSLTNNDLSAKIVIQSTSNKYIRIGGGDSTLISMRIDGSGGGLGNNGIFIQSYGNGNRCLEIIANSGSEFAISSHGAHVFGQRAGERWCAPGVLWCGFYQCPNWAPLLVRHWGDGLGLNTNGTKLIPTIERHKNGSYTITHSLGHTDYFATVICSGQIRDNYDWWQPYATVFNINTNSFQIQVKDEGGKEKDPLEFQVMIFGRNRW